MRDIRGDLQDRANLLERGLLRPMPVAPTPAANEAIEAIETAGVVDAVDAVAGNLQATQRL